MRSFIITVILFFIVLSSIILNAQYISRTTATIIEYTNENEFKKASNELVVMTDDGSYGRQGNVCVPLEEMLASGKKIDKIFLVFNKSQRGKTAV